MTGRRNLPMAATLAAAILVGAPTPARPQPSPSPQSPPPLAFSYPGWRYELRGSDVHTYICDDDKCRRGSRVSYRLLGPAAKSTLEDFQRNQDEVVKALSARLPPGGQITILEVTEERMGDLQILTAQRQTTIPGGPGEFLSSSFVLSPRDTVSFISSSPDPVANRANYTRFMLPIVVFLTTGATPKP